MQTVSKKDKRGGIRVPLLSEKVTLITEGQERVVDVNDITSDGMFLKIDDLLKPQSDVVVKLQLPGDLGSLEVNAKVARVNWAVNAKRKREHRGVGIRFTENPQGIQKILDAYVVYLRNKQIIAVSKRIIEEFFGNDGPKKFTT